MKREIVTYTLLPNYGRSSMRAEMFNFKSENNYFQQSEWESCSALIEDRLKNLLKKSGLEATLLK